VIGFVKPGSDNGTLTSSVKGTFEKLAKNNVIVFWGGTNDISKNNTIEGLKHVLNFVTNNKHTNIILTSAPHRHDLVEWLCVNEEVKIFNRKLRKLMKRQKHVSVLSADCNREFFTNHGLHMNNRGKEMIAKLVADTSSAIFCKDNMIPIPVYWTDNHGDNINNGIISNIESIKNQSVEVTSPIKSISEHLPQNVEPTSTIPMTWKDD
jgi:hypothetical protein